LDGFDGTWQAEGDDIVVTIAFDYTHEAVITTTNHIHDDLVPRVLAGTRTYDYLTRPTERDIYL